MPRYSGWVYGRVLIDAVNALDAEKTLREQALELLITQAPPLTVKHVSLVVSVEPQ